MGTYFTFNSSNDSGNSKPFMVLCLYGAKQDFRRGTGRLCFTGKAKGLKKRQVLFRHCLRNVMPSYLSIMAISVPHILGGTYIVEMVFSYPGLGTLSYESARYKDYNLLMLLCILSGAVVILCNMAAQVITERLDPRLRFVEKNNRMDFEMQR